MAATRGWRKRWKRIPAERRTSAAAALADLFQPRRTTSALPALLALSLLLHAASFPILLRLKGDASAVIANKEDAYMRRVMEKDRAMHAVKDVKDHLAAAPPTPDPEAFVAETLTQSVSTDVVQTAAKLLNMKLQEDLTKHIETTLADEIREASRKIVTGAVSREDMKELQKKWHEQAYVAARQWGEMRREEKQVDVAAFSTTEWYQERVSPQFRSMVRDGIFKGIGGPAAWSAYAGSLAGFLRDRSWQVMPLPFETKIDVLAQALQGRTAYRFDDLPDGIQFKRLEHGWQGLPDPPSWGYAVVAAKLVHLARAGFEPTAAEYIGKFHPHRRAEMEKQAAALMPLWDKALAAADAYAAKSKGAAPDALAKLHGEFAAAVKTLHDAANAMTVRPNSQLDNECAAVNQTLRSQVLRGDFVDALREHLIAAIVEKVRPAVVNLCRNQFREGMVYSKNGVDKAIEEFGVASEALLRRDISNALTRPLVERRLFVTGQNPYRSRLSDDNCPPSDEDIAADEKRLADLVAKWPENQKPYATARTGAIRQEFNAAMDAVVRDLLKRMVTPEGVLQRDFYARTETVDYTDQFQKQLDLRELVWNGRKQNIGDITEEGLPDTSNPLIALAQGMESGRVPLKPVLAQRVPGFMAETLAASALRGATPTYPPPPQPWGFVTQIKVKPPFESPQCDAIPFLPQFPNIDGDLSDWGRVRPLLLSTQYCPPFAQSAEGLPVYAGWNYQGFFFGYHVPQPQRHFHQATEYTRAADGVTLVKSGDGLYGWVAGADHCRLLFDTLDTRLGVRGDPNAQEFYVLPAGTTTNPSIPGMERIIANRRHGMEVVGMGGWPYHRCSFRMFAPQAPVADGPDGSGPYRVIKQTDTGYTVEIFIPRTILKQPVFVPGWYIGFDVSIRIGGGAVTGGANEWGAQWCTKGWGAFIDNPSTWGDLLLLGTDAEVRVQDAEPAWPRTQAVVPGHSYLVTILDPDRNTNLAAEDTVLLSAEVIPPGGASAASDTEIYILKETGNNTGVFRGFIDTLPGAGGEVYGTLEVSPGAVVRLGYLDLGDSKGRRNVVYEAKLPVAAAVISVSNPKSPVTSNQ